MKKLFLSVLLLVIAGIQSVFADTALVFNEIMYHPATNESAMEWVELYNQMAVDLDISNWSISGGIGYTFSSNVVVKGGGYLVVASSPATLISAGATNVFGPFTNRLSNNGQHLLLRNNNARQMDEVNYGTDGDWPVSPDGSGVSLAKLDSGTASKPASNWTVSRQMGGTPGRANFPAPATNLIALAFNELSAATNSGYWLELANHGTSTLALGGYIIVRDGATNGEYILPVTTLPAGGFLVLSNTTIGFHPVSGDKLYLLPPGRTNVIDAVLVKNTPRARLPDGTGAWLRPGVLTPGASNIVALHTEIVINEIMYKHQLLTSSNNLPGAVSGEQWIELYNKSPNPVNLTGWKLSGGINYDFPAGKTLASGAYLVVAKDSLALQSAYPVADIIGNFNGKLAVGGDSVVLEDDSGNPASSVRYFAGGRWPGAAAGGGSSLELKDPTADITSPEVWAASIEGGKSSWQTNTYQAVAQNLVGPTQWNDFLMGLLSDGECLVDDISVIESPTGSAVQFIANGNFESGATGWRFLGNHAQSRVEVDPNNGANHVLHVIATGHQEDLHNHIEATYTSNRKVTNGRTYKISYRVKWLSGNNLLNTRLYYDRVAKTFAMSAPQLNGTPGAQNSRYTGNAGPTFSQFDHKPVVPAASQAVTVSVKVQDSYGISSCQVWWSANSGAFSSASMTPQGNGIYSGTIPGFAAGTVVQFYVRATDNLGVVSTFPPANGNSGALYMVNNAQANLTQGHNFRVILSPANWALMRAATNLMSSAFLPGTVIYDEQRAYYDVGIRLKGSQSGRVVDPYPSFHVEFRPDDLFKGVHPSLLLDTSGRPGAANQQEEILFHHMANHAGGIPDILQDICRVIPPFQTNTSAGVSEPRFEDEFIETAFDNGGDGNIWQHELTYYPTTDNAAGYKLPSPQLLTGVDITDLGDDKEAYRYNFILKNHRAQDDYSRFIPFAKMMAMSNGPILFAQSRQLMDMDEWLRTFAMVSLVGEGDWYTFNNPHNELIYCRPEDGRMLVLPWDVEHFFSRPSNASLIGDPSDWTDLEKLYPANKRRLFAHALDIIATTFNTSYMTYWAEHYASFLPGQNYSDMLGYIPDRIAGVQSEITAAGGNAAFKMLSTNVVTTTNNLVAISGDAPVQVQSILINGIEYPVTWNSVSNWTVFVPVSATSNLLTITTLDLNNNPIPAYSTNLTVYYSGIAPNPAGKVVISEIQFNPLLTNASYLELRNTSTSTAYDLSGWKINGLDYTFPVGSIISNGQHLLLVEDRSQFVNAYNVFIPIFDAYPGKLQTDGETLTLQIPAAQTNLPEVVVDKVRYSAFAPWPATTPGVSLQLKDPAQDHFRVGNWAAATGTPGALNSVDTTLAAFPPLWLNEVQAENLTGITNSAGQRKPWLELFNSGTNAVALTNFYLTTNHASLTAWRFPTNAVLSPGQFKIIFCDGQTNLSTTNEIHTAFTLPAGAGSLALTRISGSLTQVLDFVNYTNVIPNRSYGSFPDAQVFDRQQFYYVTPGNTNNGGAAPLTVVINEFMAGNTHTLLNPVNGKYSDWFELYNYGTNTAYLDGFYLTDTLTNAFKFAIPPGYTIPPQGFLVVWADSIATNGTPDLHAGFKMSKTGESLGLYDAAGVPVDFVNYGAQSDDVSQGRFPDASVDMYFMPVATPRTNNVIPNTAPSLAAIFDRFIHAGQQLYFTTSATDAESAFQILTFSLDPGAPAGAVINPVSGQFTWTTTDANAPGTNVITIRVTDNGTPFMSDAKTFTVTVQPRPVINCSAPTGGLLPMTFGTLPGRTYQVEFKNDLGDSSWTPLGTPAAGTGGVIQLNDDITGQPSRFYRVTVLP